MKQGRKPSLEEIAAEAWISRATAYRYFPNVEALLVEASFDVAIPEAGDLFPDGLPVDPAARVERVDAALHDVILANEAALRTMLAHSLAHHLADAKLTGLPARQNRRTPLIEAALKPARKQFKPGALMNLGHALALIIGPEAMVVLKDVLQLEDAEARRVKRWAIRALVEAARKSRPTD
jgi:AcrR family transcriptional regulator